MHKIFVSYARSCEYGKKLAAKIQKRLQEQDYLVFRDVTHLQPGEFWLQKLEHEIKASQIVIVVLSKGITESTWVPNECRMAEQLGIPIIPVQAEHMEYTPLWIGQLQILDFKSRFNSDALLNAVKNYLPHAKSSNDEVDYAELVYQTFKKLSHMQQLLVLEAIYHALRPLDEGNADDIKLAQRKYLTKIDKTC